MRQRVADGVGQVDDGRAGLDRDAADAGDERRVGPGRVLARELDLVGEGARVLDRAARLAHDLGRLQAELPLHVHRARRDEDVDARAAGARERLAGSVDVLDPRPRERGDRRCAERERDLAHALEVARGRAREARLDDVDAEPFELLGDLRLLVRLQRDPGRLLAVAQGRIEDGDPAS